MTAQPTINQTRLPMLESIEELKASYLAAKKSGSPAVLKQADDNVQLMLRLMVATQRKVLALGEQHRAEAEEIQGFIRSLSECYR